MLLKEIEKRECLTDVLYISSGTEGDVYECKRSDDNGHVEHCALKVSHFGEEQANELEAEGDILQKLNGENHFPKILSNHKIEDRAYLVTEFIGEDLYEVVQVLQRMPMEEVLDIGYQMLEALEVLHALGLVHRDIKPQNILLDKRDNNTARYCLIDFAMASKFLCNDGTHLDLKKAQGMAGSMVFCARAAHRQESLARRDDLESLLYVIIYLLGGSLPWMREFSHKDYVQSQATCEIKNTFFSQTQKKYFLPEQLEIYRQHIAALPFDGSPDYALLKECLRRTTVSTIAPQLQIKDEIKKESSKISESHEANYSSTDLDQEKQENGIEKQENGIEEHQLHPSNRFAEGIGASEQKNIEEHIERYSSLAYAPMSSLSISNTSSSGNESFEFIKMAAVDSKSHATSQFNNNAPNKYSSESSSLSFGDISEGHHFRFGGNNSLLESVSNERGEATGIIEDSKESDKESEVPSNNRQHDELKVKEDAPNQTALSNYTQSEENTKEPESFNESYQMRPKLIRSIQEKYEKRN